MDFRYCPGIRAGLEENLSTLTALFPQGSLQQTREDRQAPIRGELATCRPSAGYDRLLCTE